MSDEDSDNDAFFKCWPGEEEDASANEQTQNFGVFCVCVEKKYVGEKKIQYLLISGEARKKYK